MFTPCMMDGPSSWSCIVPKQKKHTKRQADPARPPKKDRVGYGTIDSGENGERMCMHGTEYGG